MRTLSRPPSMWRLLVLPLFLLGPAAGLRAGDLRHYDDAPLHAVQFLDAREGWAVGDEGVVLHTTDGGVNWERQPSGVSASLRGVCFLDPAVGWAVGREEAPGSGAAGVLLRTEDGGWTWKRLLLNTVPALHVVRFVSEKVGYLAGEGSDAYPSGVFRTADGGRSWQPVAGPRTPAWFAADFDADGGALAGAWNRLATLRGDRVNTVEMDSLGGRNLRGLQLRGKGGVAVGQGGLVLVSSGTHGSGWGAPDLKLPLEIIPSWDFHAVHGTGEHVWAVGRPGSAALHSPDGGKNWEVIRTGQSLPLNGVFFADERVGWAVGELGTVVATRDGGKTWDVRRRGGQRAAVLFAHARPAGLPADGVAQLGGQEGYLAAGVCVTAPDPASAALGQSTDASRFAAAVRSAGGAGGEGLWQFPVPSHLAGADRAETLAAWDRLHGDHAAEGLLRQLVLALRVWRPDVVVTDGPDATSPCRGVESLVAEATREAFTRAADPAAFPEQLKVLGLEAWKPSKLYARSDGPAGCPVRIDLSAFSPPLRATLHDFAEGPASLLGSAVPAERRYRLLASNLPGAESHAGLFEGVSLAPGGVARRLMPPTEAPPSELLKAARTRANFRALSESPGALADPDRMLANIGPMLKELPDDQAAPAAHAIALAYARRGQWNLARETFLLLADRYPTHPLSLDALRWLIRHNSSSEARRRHELGEFALVTQYEMGVPKAPAEEKSPADGKARPEGKSVEARTVSLLNATKSDRLWYQGCLEMGTRLEAFGPLQAGDPSVQFCLQSARRNLGESAKTQEWYREFAARFPDSPWRPLALCELWLANRTGPPPRPVLLCRPAEARPFLDGKLDDACWQGGKALPLVTAVGDRNVMEKEYPTETRVSYDAEYLYVAVRCAHPEGKGEAAARVRTRDGDLRAHDRVSLLLDLDRDYSTCFHFQVDATGCVAEDCWGDRSWNPRWFVAIRREPTAWTAEISIPMDALAADRVSSGRAWAVNVLRTLPGRGVQALSTPAEAPEEALRPEGMGLLLFGAARPTADGGR